MTQLVGRLISRVLLAAVLLFLLAPLIATVYVAFSPVNYAQFPPSGGSFRWFEQLWHTPQLLTAFARSLVLAAIVTPLVGILATAAALGLESARRASRAAGGVLFQVPLIVPQLVLGIALLTAYSLFGLNNTYLGLGLAHLVVAFPFFLRAVDVSLAQRDIALEEAASVLGSSPLKIFRTVTVPSIRAGLLSGAVFAFVVSFDQFAVTLFIVGHSTQTLPVAIYNYLFQNSNPTVAAISTIVIALGLAAAFLAHRLVGLDKLIVGEERAVAAA
jgi:putative spermidine/putrescine transport system permease protein